MSEYKCPQCGYTLAIGMEISMGGAPQHKCENCGAVMIDMHKMDSMLTRVSISDNTYMGVGSMANVKIGGDLENRGSIEVKGRGELEVARNMVNEGKLTVDDPITYKEIVLEGIKTTGSVAELGTYILKKLGLGIL